jgi:hypothetical protein
VTVTPQHRRSIRRDVGQFATHPPRTGKSRTETSPRHLTLDEADHPVNALPG